MYAALKRRTVEIKTEKNFDLEDSMGLLIKAMKKAEKKGAILKKQFDEKKEKSKNRFE